MGDILLTSEGFVKQTCAINDNVSAKYLLPSIKEAQDIQLTGILGSKQIARLKEGVKLNNLTTIEKELLNKCQYFLAYAATAQLLVKISYKVTNVGVVKTGGENVTPVSQTEVAYTRDYYQARADFYAYEVQIWLQQNYQQFPLLSSKTIDSIASNLKSAASCGIFLGGARGKAIRKPYNRNR